MRILNNISFIYLVFSTQLISQSISGVVLESFTPAAGVIVKVQASTISDTTNEKGEFLLNGVTGSDSLLITAYAFEYYVGSSKALPGQQSLIINLKRYSLVDNKSYKWIPPTGNSSDPQNCINCHKESYEQWSNNLHSQAAIDPLVMTMYNGTDIDGRKNVEPGFKIDFPETPGSCANCHAPTAAMVYGSWETDLNEISGVDAYGVHCDYCHKIFDARSDIHGVSPGYMSIDVLRPDSLAQIFFGTIDDSPRNVTYHPLYKKSLYCAPCHQWFNAKVPIYSSYTEWLNSPYPKMNIECQNCHMKSDGITTNFAEGNGGIERDPKTIPSHNQMGFNDSLFIAQTVDFKVQSFIKADTLLLNVAIKNAYGGHHFPTGNPIRNAILVVQVSDERNNSIKYLGNNILPNWAGSGGENNDYAGLPGKGYAKILQDRDGNYPAPQWRLVTIRSDTRIPAMKTDISNYSFLIPNNSTELNISTKVIYRKAFKYLSKVKGWNLKDYTVASYTQKINLDESLSTNKTQNKCTQLPFLYCTSPNPFHSIIIMEFYLPNETSIKLEIFNYLGQKIRVLLEDAIKAGTHSVEWDGLNDSSIAVASGIYLCRLTSSGYTLSRKIINLRQ